MPKFLSEDEFFNKFGKSRYSANTTELWSDGDSEYKYRNNMKSESSRKLLQDNGWTDKNVKYQYNNYGFRSPDDFDIVNPAPGIMYLGCSVTFGVGMNVEDTWAYKVHQKIAPGSTYYNLAHAGTGIETQYRLLKAWAPKLNIKTVYSIGAFPFRREFIHNTPRAISYNTIASWSDKMPDKQFFQYFLSNDEENDISMIRVYDAIQHLTREYSFEFNIIDHVTNRKEWYDPTIEKKLARDLHHWGPKMHDGIVRSFNSGYIIELHK